MGKFTKGYKRKYARTPQRKRRMARTAKMQAFYHTPWRQAIARARRVRFIRKKERQNGVPAGIHGSA